MYFNLWIDYVHLRKYREIDSQNNRTIYTSLNHLNISIKIKITLKKRINLNFPFYSFQVVKTPPSNTHFITSDSPLLTLIL